MIEAMTNMLDILIVLCLSLGVSTVALGIATIVLQRKFKQERDFRVSVFDKSGGLLDSHFDTIMKLGELRMQMELTIEEIDRMAENLNNATAAKSPHGLPEMEWPEPPMPDVESERPKKCPIPRA